MNKSRVPTWIAVLSCLLFGIGLFIYWPVVGAWAGRWDESMIIRGDPIPGQLRGPDLPLGSVVVELRDTVRESRGFYLPLLRFHASVNGYVEWPWPVAHPRNEDVILFVRKGTPFPPGWEAPLTGSPAQPPTSP